MTILHCSLYEKKGKYVILSVDDGKDTDNESQFDIIMNRLQTWEEKAVKFRTLIDPRVNEHIHSKNNKLSTKVATWLTEKKQPITVMPLAHKVTMDLSDNMKLLMSWDDEMKAGWAAGKIAQKNLSIKSWSDVLAEAKTYVDKYAKDKKNELWHNELKKSIEEAPTAFPFIAADMKRKDSDKVMNMMKRIITTELGQKFAMFLVRLEMFMTAMAVTDALAAALKSDDRIYLFTSINVHQLNVLPMLLVTQLQFTAVASSDPESEDVSDKELSAVMDGFVVKKAAGAAKKKKKGKKKAAGAGAGAGAGAKKEDGAKPAAAAGAGAGDKKAEAEAKAAPKKAADDDDDDDDGPELPLIAEEKVNPKKGPQRSTLILDIVGDSPELDMKALEDKVRAYKPEGLTWGDAGLEDLAFGIKILRIAALLLNDKVKADDVVAALEKVENVQSVEIHAHNTL